MKAEWVDNAKQYLHVKDGIELERELEEKICKFTGASYCTVVNSGTNALYMAMLIPLKQFTYYKDKKDILVPNYGHPAIEKCCIALGLNPIYVGMDPKTLSMDFKKAESKITSKTAAIVHVENNGVIGRDIFKFRKLCNDYNLLLVEDAAPSMIQRIDQINAGVIGDIGIYSFSYSKPFHCGEGAAIVTKNQYFDKAFKAYRYNHNYMDMGMNLNFSLSPYLIAMLLPQFETINNVIKTREDVHAEYKSHGIPVFEEEGVTNRYPYAMLINDNASNISRKLNNFKIGHRYMYYPVYDYDEITIQTRSKLIDLPCHEDLTSAQIKTISTLIKKELV